MAALPVLLLFLAPQLVLGAAALLSARRGHVLHPRIYALHAVTLLASSALAVPGASLFSAVHPLLGWVCAAAPLAVALGISVRIFDRGSGRIFQALPGLLLVAIILASGAAVAYRIAIFRPTATVRLPGLPGPQHARWSAAVVALALELNLFALWWAIRHRHVHPGRRPLYLAVASTLVGAGTLVLLGRMYDAPTFLRGGPVAPIIAPLGAALSPSP